MTVKFREENVSIRKVASLTCTMVSYTQGVDNSLLHYRVLKSCKNEALSRNNLNFDENMTLTPGALEDIQWWIDVVRHEFTGLVVNRGMRMMGPRFKSWLCRFDV